MTRAVQATKVACDKIGLKATEGQTTQSHLLIKASMLVKTQ